MGLLLWCTEWSQSSFFRVCLWRLVIFRVYSQVHRFGFHLQWLLLNQDQVGNKHLQAKQLYNFCRLRANYNSIGREKKKNNGKQGNARKTRPKNHQGLYCSFLSRKISLTLNGARSLSLP